MEAENREVHSYFTVLGRDRLIPLMPKASENLPPLFIGEVARWTRA